MAYIVVTETKELKFKSMTEALEVIEDLTRFSLVIATLKIQQE